MRNAAAHRRFFDGTGNNQDWVEDGAQATQLQRRKDSNVARLFRAYPSKPSKGYFRAYVPGVGTPFSDIGEAQSRSMGAAFGAGGDGRINFGLLHVINAVHSKKPWKICPRLPITEHCPANETPTP